MTKVFWIGLAVVIIVVGAGGVIFYIKSKPAAPVAVPETVAVASPSPVATAVTVNNDLVKTQTNSKGDFLTDPKGMTLYVYDKDTPNVSNCSGACAKTWPPYLQKKPASTPTVLPTDFATTKRTDGTVMYTYKGWPLYYYAKDVSSGDVTGDGVEEVWHLAKP